MQAAARAKVYESITYIGNKLVIAKGPFGGVEAHSDTPAACVTLLIIELELARSSQCHTRRTKSQLRLLYCPLIETKRRLRSRCASFLDFPWRQQSFRPSNSDKRGALWDPYSQWNALYESH